MFQNLEQVKSWLNTVGTPVPHTLVKGEAAWILDQTQRLQELVDQDMHAELLNDNLAEEANARYRTALEEHAALVAARKAGDEEVTRRRKEHAVLQGTIKLRQEQLGEKKAKLNEYRENTPAWYEISDTVLELETEISNLAAQTKDLSASIGEYLNPGRPERPVVEYHSTDNAPIGAADYIEQALAFLKAGTSGQTTAGIQADVLRSYLKDLATLTERIEQAAKALGSDAEVSREDVQLILDEEISETTRKRIGSILGSTKQ